MAENRISAVFTANIGKFKSAMSQVSSSVKDASKNVQSRAEEMSGAFEGVATAIAGIGTTAVVASSQVSDAFRNIDNSLNVPQKEAEKYKKVIQNLAKDGVGSWDELSSQVVATTQLMGDAMNPKQLENFVGGASAVSKTFDADYNEVLRASKVLMEEYGMTGQEALDHITAGYKNGGNYAGDMLDTITEYAPTFQAGGGTAEDFFNTMTNGGKNGVISTDKLMDAWKEFGILSLETGEDQKNAYKSMNLNMEDYQARLAKGGDTAKKAQDEIMTALAGIEDPIERNKAGQGLFGTMWEDLSGEAILSTASMKNSYGVIEGGAKDLQDNTKTFSQIMLGAWNSVSLALTPLGERIKEIATAVMPIIVSAVEKLAKGFSGLSPTMQTVVLAIGGLVAISPILLTAFAMIVGFIPRIVQGASLLVKGFGLLKTGIGGLVKGFKLVGTAFKFISKLFMTNPWILVIVAVVALAVVIYKNWDTIKEYLKVAWDWIAGIASSVWNGIKDFFIGLFNGIVSFIKLIWDGIKAYFTFVFNVYKTIFTTAFNIIKTVITTIFNGVKTFISKIWNGIKNFFVTTFNFLKNAFTNGFNIIRNTISSVMNKVKSIISTIWNAVKNVFFTTLNWIREKVIGGFTTIRDKIVGFMNKVKEVISSAWTNIKEKFREGFSNLVSKATGFKTTISNKFQEVKTAISNKFVEIKDKMKEKFQDGIDSVVKKAKEIPGKIGTAISDKIGDVKDAIKGLADKIIDTFKDALGIHSPSRVFTTLGQHVIQGLKNGLSKDNIKDFAVGIFDGVSDGAVKAWDTISDLFSGNSLSGIKSFFTGMGDSIGDFFKGGDIGAGVGKGVDKWKQVATQALMMTGQYTPANLDRLLYQMKTESGGNPKAINLWDSNWEKGTPSKGLMQVIDPTFQAHKMKGHNDIWNPLDNILASIRYAVSRYGSLQNAYKGVGYASGGIFKGTQQGSLIHMAENGGDEAVVPLSNKSRMKPFAYAVGEYAMNKLGNIGGNSGGVVINGGLTIPISMEIDGEKVVKETIHLTQVELERLAEKQDRLSGKRR